MPGVDARCASLVAPLRNAYFCVISVLNSAFTPRATGPLDHASQQHRKVIYIAKENGKLMSNLKTIENLLVEELKDLYSAETQITKTLPKLVKAASSPDL